MYNSAFSNLYRRMIRLERISPEEALILWLRILTELDDAPHSSDRRDTDE